MFQREKNKQTGLTHFFKSLKTSDEVITLNKTKEGNKGKVSSRKDKNTKLSSMMGALPKDCSTQRSISRNKWNNHGLSRWH